MPRPKQVTAEAIRKILSKMRRMNIHQNKKIQIGERPDGQPIYHYPSITKAKTAKALGVSADYLTSIKDPEILEALRYVGQRRSNQDEIDSENPKLNTKQFFINKTKRQAEKIKKLETSLKSSKKKTLEYKINRKKDTDHTDRINLATEQLKEIKGQLRLADSKIKGLRLEVASLRLEKELQNKEKPH